MVGTKGIAVAIGSREVKGVLFSSFLGRTKVERLESSTSIEGLLDSFHSDAAITLVLPVYLFMTRKVTLPFVDSRIVRKTLPFELEGIIPVPMEDVLVDSVSSGRADGGSSVLALAVPRNTIDDVLRLFPEGRMPRRIIPDFVSLLSLGVKIQEEKEAIYGVLSIERESLSLVVLAGETPVMVRAAQMAGDGTAIAEWVETTVRPLQQDGTAVRTLYVCGEAAEETIARLDRLAEVVPLPEMVNGVRGRNWLAWSTLAGGALSAAEFPRFNVLGEQRDDEVWLRTVKTVVMGTVALLALGTADLYIRYASASRTLSALRAESKQLFVSVMPQVKNVVKEDAQMRVALTRERATREALIGRPSGSFLTVSKGIERLVGDHPEVKIREADVETGRVTIVGEGRGGGGEGLKRLFSGIDGSQDVQVEEIVQGVEPNSYRFRVKVQMK